MSRRHTLLFALGLAAAMVAIGPAWGGPGDGAVVGTTKILDNGAASDRYNLVILAEGYQAGQLAQFHADAQQFVDFLLSTPPFNHQCGAFNVYRVDVRSTDSGADDPSGAPCNGTGATVATYFDGKFCYDGAIRRLLGVNTTTATNVLNAQVPEWDQALVIVNDPLYGGSGGAIGVTSVSGTWENIAVHEFGHSGFGLADEYEYYAGPCNAGGEPTREHHPAAEPAQPNATIETDRNLVKWKDLIAGATAVPTTVNADCTACDPQPNPVAADTVGVFEGADYYHCDAYRPQFDCMMRNYAPFCAVCSRRIVQTLAPFRAPNRAPVANAGDDQLAECTAPTGTLRLLNGTQSSDADCDELTFAWSSPGVTFNDATLQTPTGTFSLGNYVVTLTVDDGTVTDDDTVNVNIQDTLLPTAHITAPPNGICSRVPVTVTDDSSDICDATLTHTYNPPPGPTYSTTGDYHVVLTVRDDSLNADTDSVDFTVDSTPPVVTFLTPPLDQLANPPLTIPIRIEFSATDNDGATGGIDHEVIKLESCVLYDGDTEGDRDGLLSDEYIQVTKYTLCQAMARCGLLILNYPRFIIESTDTCGTGNTGSAQRIFRKLLRKVDVCS